MSYSFPYALGICLATIACLAACTWLYMIAIEEAAAWLNRLEDRAAARKRAEAAAYQVALDALARLRARAAAEAAEAAEARNRRA
jgi:hypothetical protein